MSLDSMFKNINKFQSGYELFTTLRIVGDSDLASIYEYLLLSWGSYCKNESIVIVVSGNWEYETGLLQKLETLVKQSSANGKKVQ